MESKRILSGPSNEQDQGSGSRTLHQVQRLEKFYEKIHFPSTAETHQLSAELGLEPNEITLWFRNRRDQTEAEEACFLMAEEASSEIVILREENEKLRLENSTLKENLVTGTANCSTCQVSSLLQANAERQLEQSEATNQAMRSMARGFADSLYGIAGNPRRAELDPLRNLNMQNLGSQDFMLLMHETARWSTEELIKLLTTGDMFWLDSFVQGQKVLNLTNYKRNLASSHYFLHNNICEESSKASCLVHLNGKELVDMLLDPKRRMGLFPLILSDSHMAKELAVGDTATRSGYSQLVYERVHTVSPFIQNRWFYILRHCKQIEDGKWVIADISFDYYKNRPNVGPVSHLKHPSGCMIQDLGNGFSEVTWVEHVGADPRSGAVLLHLYYIQSGLAYCAKRWVCTLQTTMERNLNMISTFLDPTYELIIDTPWLQSVDEKRKVLERCNIMTASFYSSFPMAGEVKVIKHNTNTLVEAKIAIRKNPVQGSMGFVVCVSSSLLIPASANVLFDFLCDADNRSKWDSLCPDGACVLAKIPTGALLGNEVSIIKPFGYDNNVIIQEVSSNEMGKHISFAPHKASMTAMTAIPARSVHPRFAWLPSGFTIFEVAHPPNPSSGGTTLPSGCVLTAVFNFRFTGLFFPIHPNLINFDHVKPAFDIMKSFLLKIKREMCRQQ